MMHTLVTTDFSFAVKSFDNVMAASTISEGQECPALAQSHA